MTVTELTKYYRHGQSECDSCMYTVSQKNVPLWLAITLMHVMVGWLAFNVPFHHKYGYIRDDDAREWILIFLAEMLPIKQAVKRRFTMPAQIT